MDRRILMILYYYPPIGGIGAARTLRLVRHLPTLGWEPLVLTVSTRTLAVIPCPASDGEVPGARLFRTPNPDIAFRIKRLAGLDISRNVEAEGAESHKKATTGAAGWASRWLGLPDRFIDWYPFARRTALELCRLYSPDLVFSSSPPETSHLLAASVKRRTGIPWHADMRDPWTEKFNMPRPPLPGRLNAWIEARTLPHADRITTVAQPLAEMMRERLGLEAAVIPNSWDEEAFDEALPHVDGRFNLLYAGTLYYPTQDPGPLFRALREMREAGRDLSQMVVQFAGKNTSLVKRLAAEEGVEDLVETLGILPFKEAVARQKGATALLYLQVRTGEGRLMSDSPGGKLLDYLGAGRPVLSLMPLEGPMDDFITGNRVGSVTRDAGSTRAVLEAWLDEYARTGALGHKPAAGLDSLNSKAMASRFDDLFRDLLG